MAQEYNFDGLVGPTHNYGGLSYGNIASMSNSGEVSSPKKAALQGINKMRHLMDMGIPQAVLPPHERPHGPTLRAFGFRGTVPEMVQQAAMANPAFLANVSSASAMWTANAATVSPSADTSDGRLHLTPASLTANFHRSIEAAQTTRILKHIFRNEENFCVHDPLPGGGTMGDEGAANHGRLCASHGDAGVELFVYGASAFSGGGDRTFPARQALETCHAIATTHGLSHGKVVLAQQSITAINAGAFHNDVVSVANGNVLFYHEQAFEDERKLIEGIQRSASGFEPVFIKVPADEVPLGDAIKSYLFNSQLVTRPDDGMSLILPEDAQINDATRRYVERLMAAGTPVDGHHYMDLRESMRNGGGPACLRLRVAMTEAEVDALGGNVVLDSDLADTLEGWVRKHYRDELAASDLADPDLVTEVQAALDELTQILQLGALYDFQRQG